MGKPSLLLIMKRPLEQRALAIGCSFGIAVGALAALAGLAEGRDDGEAPGLEMAASIGRSLFFDSGLSRPIGQSCYNCHLPHSAFAGTGAVAEGAVSGRFGIRNVPTLMYAALIPSMALEERYDDEGVESMVWEGGLFHDGRAQDQFEQVKEPFFASNEMNLRDEAELAARLRSAGYGERIRRWIGEEAWQDDQRLSYFAYRALVEFLKEPVFRPFDARIDDFLAGDHEALDEAERRGLEVFRGAGKCADCHLLEAASWQEPLLSDYGYDNVGAPSRGEKDPGLGGHTNRPEELGLFRAPTLRNVALTAPYMHNGSIATLKEVMEFYNRRDLEPDRWGPTDYPQTVNRTDMGDLRLTDQQVEDLTALMDSFTDRSLTRLAPGQVIPKTPEGTPSTASRRRYFPDWTYRLDPRFPGEPEGGD